MKKIVLTITAAVITTLSVNAQVDYAFETWADVPNAAAGVQDPQGWASFNILTNMIFGMQQTVYKETAAPYKGSSAAKIVTKPIPSTVSIPGYDTVGLLAIGKIDLLSQKIQLGTPFGGRPATFSFATKYEPVSVDSASVSIRLTKYNTTTKVRDVIAAGYWVTNVNSTTWTPQTLTLVYDNNFNNVTPDTLIIAISSSGALYPKVNSTLYIDDISYAGWVSTNDLGAIKNNVTVYPTPARANVNFSSTVNAKNVEILDITGRSVGVFQMVNNKVTVDTQKYESGMYIYNVLNDQSQVIGRGKFEVLK
jgi:hypothetical protein